MSLVLDEHREYLSDEARLSAFRRAIEEVVKPGDVVVDLGSGTGILGLLALRSGAARVYALDNGGLTQLEREIFAANGFADRVVCVKGLSTRINLPELADVVVSDQIGRFGFEAGAVQYFADARRRLLKPSARMTPLRIDLCVAPVEAASLAGEIDFWRQSPQGFDFAPAHSIAINTGHPTSYQPHQILSEPSIIASIDLTRDCAPVLSGKAACNVRRRATLHGIGGWFAALLSPSVTMTNSPLSGKKIGRRAVFFPLHPALAVEPDDCVQIAMKIVPEEKLVSWRAAIFDKNGRQRARFVHSTFLGMLFCPEDLQKARPDFVPKLTKWGEARRTVVDLCDGRRNVAEIEREVYERHRNLFASPAEAAVFVVEVMVPYAYEDRNI